MKRIASLLLAVVMIFGLVGCAAAPAEKNEPTSEQPKLTVTEENTYSKPMPNMPEVPYWFPSELLEWDPAQDPNAAYNVSSIPLAERVNKDELNTVNATQNKDVNVVALCGMNAGTSGSSPHGLNTVKANVFSYWQYIDKMVYWGGSSGEGLILAPSADVIDAGHRNGVPVLGTVFFPQAAHGGKIQWLNEFLQKDEDGNFPMIPKLIEVCEYFGFDGFFINQETEGSENDPDGLLTAEHAELMREFVKAFKAAAGDKLEIMWYDAMTIEGAMDWQNALTEKNAPYIIDEEGNPVADSMFLNFWWTYKSLAPEELLRASAAKAAELGVDPYNLYAGIDVQANGYKTRVNYDLFAPAGQAPYTSLGLYCPSWAYEACEGDFFDKFQDNESKLWVNEKGDPFLVSQVAEKEWRGISNYAVEQTVINKVPFITNFSMGHGYSFFIDGQKVSNKDWNNRSMQDVLPTYRWHIEQGEGSALKATVDYGEAVYGGTSLKLFGKVAANQPTLWKLFSAQLPITEDLTFTATAKASLETAMNLVVTLADGTTETITGDQKVGADWTKVTFDVKPLAGKTVTSISFELTTAEDGMGTKFYLGQMAVTSETATLESAVTELKVDGTSFDDDDCMYSGVRLSWNAAEGADFYEIYRVNQDETLSFLGVTPATTHYINALERNDTTNKTSFKVVPVNIYGARGAASNVATMEWPDNSMPKANFKASATLAAPGQEITFQALCSSNTETVEWEFPGADVETATGENPTVTYSAEGVYTVKATAKNASGEAVAEKVDLITISSLVPGELTLLSQGKDTEATAYVNDNEAPQFAVDGDISKKWCATGNPPHALTIDLGDVMTVSEVKVFHAEAGGEGASMNTKAYTILVSEDGEEWTEVVKVTKNFDGESSDTFPVVSARYVKLVVEKPTQGADTAARIYEVQVFGLEGGL